MLPDVIEKLQQLVFDESKIVTYKTLSAELKININVSKKYLQEFFELNQKNLGAYYVLIGILEKEDRKVTKVVIVPAGDLEATKSNFTAVTSSHIYCVHKGELVDKLALFADCGGKFENGLSCIKNPRIHIQKERKIEIPAKNITTITKEEHKAVVKEENKAIVKEENKTVVKAKTVVQNHSSSNNGSDIFSLFQKKQAGKNAAKDKTNENDSSNVSDGKEQQIDKKTNDKSISNGTTASGTKKPNETGKGSNSKFKNANPLQHLFSKQIEKNAAKPPKKAEDNKLSSPEAVSKPRPKQESSEKRKKSPRTSKKQKKTSDSDSGDESVKPQKKKHRRIVAVSDDSDFESENEEKADRAQRELSYVEPIDDVPTIPDVVDDDDEDCIPPTPNIGIKKKKWKMVTKTFMDEHGYLLTKKTKEYVTDSEESESESIDKPKPQAASKESIEKPTFVNRKQVSLTSFFKQK